MFLALAFGLFLTAPLLLLVASVVRTAVGVSRGKDTSAPMPAAKATDAPAPVVKTAPTREVAAPATSLAPRFGRRTRPAARGGERRDFFGDVVVAKRPVTTPAPVDVQAGPTETLTKTSAPSTPPALTPAVVQDEGPQGTLLEFPMREAQLERLRQQYAGRA